MSSSASKPITETTSVYKYSDEFGILLYVGITKQGMARNGQHNADKAWWPFVSRQTVEHFNSRQEALAREAELIRRFRPPFNTQHNPDFRDIRRGYLELREHGGLGQPVGTRLSAQGGKFVRMFIVRDGESMAFLSHIADASIWQCIVAPNGQSRIIWCGGRVGWTRKIYHENGVYRVETQLTQPWPREARFARGRIRVVSQKKPIQVELMWVELLVREVPSVRVVSDS